MAETDKAPPNSAAKVERATLYVVSTPIGNLRDITLRAIDVLSAVDLVAAEDTRHSRKLFGEYGVRTPMISFHDFNKERQAPKIIKELQSGKAVALISDAGTPGISDPGFYLIREAIRTGIRVQAIPGPTALIPALILSGLPVHRFVFEGFPPPKKGRRRFFEALAGEERTIILYESPHRLQRTLADLLSACGDRNVAIARELTKKFEEILRGRLSELIKSVESRPLKGEIVLVVEGKQKKDKEKA
ncbi:MAG: 16S rRNA (cytidine(1402)-2'-O)-methyltransferase [candidate division KSB1 bacterium]|nr:16S rRNA (cytidine(1402)-2'-O)-methyltransferase [candidate division KSB1 bacterium]MDQ7064526.1 16S rRNA (cytidine(1402)-2'-O)-methyltransferase [candidate division KSB1 bacterium]